MELRGKTVLLTGASGGIGQAIALQLAAAGARLVLVARNTARLATLQAELAAKHPADHQIFSADLNQGTRTARFAGLCPRPARDRFAD